MELYSPVFLHLKPRRLTLHFVAFKNFVKLHCNGKFCHYWSNYKKLMFSIYNFKIEQMETMFKPK